MLHPGGSDGRLCLGGTIGRFNTQVQNTGADGSFAIWVDLANIPVVPAVAVVPGDTWHYQAWHRDGPTFNTSQGVEITFQ